MIFKSKTFSYAEDLCDFVMRNGIKKELIQEITCTEVKYNAYSDYKCYTLFWWVAMGLEE